VLEGRILVDPSVYVIVGDAATLEVQKFIEVFGEDRRLTLVFIVKCSRIDDSLEVPQNSVFTPNSVAVQEYGGSEAVFID